jgi:16S rRNA (uracil1498-N3)-methyltransferase
MSTPRLYLDTQLTPCLEIEAEAGQAHHLGNVLRRVPGDAVLIFNARDGEWAGRIASLKKDRCRIALEAQREREEALLEAARERETKELALQRDRKSGV